jgi:ABC-2 type transport system permease protein
MTVFSNYFKIIKKYKTVIIMYTAIAIFFAVISTLNSQNTTGFVSTKPNVAIINNDENTEFIRAFNKYIGENTKIIDVKNEENSIKDALFFRDVSYVLIIPSNYTSDLFKGLDPKIKTLKTPDSSATFTEMLLNRYLKMANIYVKTDMSQAEVVSYIQEDLKNETSIVLDSKTNKSNLTKMAYYYNFANYSFLFICIYIIGIILTSFNDEKIKKRNLISKIPYKKISNQLFAGSLCVISLIWALYVIISLVLYKEAMISKIGGLLIINSFAFCITSASIGFLIGNMVKSKEASSGIVNVIALGSSFICGAFVPQEFLGQTVLNVAKILPSYWYISNNNYITSLTSFDIQSLKPVMLNILVILIFAIIFIFITRIYNRFKLKKSN